APAGTLQASVARVLGDGAAGSRATLSADGKLTFDGAGFVPSQIDAALSAKGLKGVDLTANISVAGAQVQAQLTIAALQTLKKAGDDAVTVSESGTISVKDGAIDRAEVSALVSTALGQKLTLDTTGHLVDAAGKISGDASAKLKLALDHTTIDGTGQLAWKDGKIDSATVSATLGGAKLTGGATLAVNADGTEVALTAKAAGGKVGADGSFELDKGKLTALSASSNLVIGSVDKPAGSLKGLVAVSNNAAGRSGKIDVDAEVSAGILSASAGVSASVSVAPLAVDAKKGGDDAVRARVIAAGGGAYETWAGSFGAKVSVGITANVGPAGIPVTVGIRAGAGHTISASAVVRAPSVDASAPLVTIMHAPESAADVLAMRAGEAWTDQADHDLLIGGNVALGAVVPGSAAGVSVGGDVSFHVSGNLKREIFFDGERVRVRISRGEGKVAVESIQMGVHLEPSALKLPGGDAESAIAQKAAPLVEKYASLGFQQSWEQDAQSGVAFEMMFDPKNPAAASALTDLLRGNLTSAQKLAADGGPGVVLTKAVRTSLRSEQASSTLSGGGAALDRVSKWIDDKTQSFDPAGVTFVDDTEGTTSSKATLPWRTSSWSSDIKLVHQQTIASTSSKDDKLGAIEATTSIGRPVDVASPEAMLSFVHVDVSAASKPTSLLQLKGYVGGANAVLDAFAVPLAQRGSFGDLAGALSDGKAPARSGPLGGLVDGRFGATRFEIEGVVGPAGLAQILKATPDACVRAFLAAQGGLQSDTPLLASKAGLAAHIAADKNCTFAPRDNGAYELFDNKQRSIGILSDAQLTDLQTKVLAALRFDVQPRDDDDPLLQDIAQSTGIQMRSIDFLWARAMKSEAQELADAVQKAQALVAARDPAKSSAADNDKFLDDLDGLFRKALKDRLPARLAFVMLAGKDNATLRGGIAMQKDARAAIATAIGKPVTTTSGGADFAFNAGTAPTDPAIAGTLANAASTDGAWMSRDGVA
ncbi:MAG TPA: hypothetical protein VGO62_17815, partial [Myxococcota bacterium]